MTSSKGSFRNLSVDLGNRHARPALEVLLQMERRRSKVRSARVFTTSGYISNGSGSVSCGAAIAGIFELLSKLPNLKHLTIDFHNYLPLQALCFLSPSPRLKTITMENVQLTGTLDSEQDVSPLLSQTLTHSQSLQELTLLHCRGSAAVEPLFTTGLPASLRKLTVANTPLGSTPETIARTMSHLGANPNLVSLKLLEVPSLTDQHMDILMAASTTTTTTTRSNLTELEFTSNILGPTAGRSVIQTLQHPQSALEHLKLHVDWEDCGVDIATMLRTNTRLKQLDIRLYGDDDDVREGAIQIARALQHNHHSALRRLRLCLEMEPGPEEQSILDAFEQTLTTNETLRYLELDDTIEEFPLPLTVESKLKLNRSGAPKLWRKNSATPAQFVQALVSQKDDLNTIYEILRNQPTLCSCCEATASESLNLSASSSLDCCSSEEEEYHHAPSFFSKSPTSKNGSSNSPTKRRTRVRRFFPKKVRSIFATSA